MNWLYHENEVVVSQKLPTEAEIKNVCDDFNITNIYELDGKLVARWASNKNRSGNWLAVVSWREDHSSRPYTDTVSSIFVTKETVNKLEMYNLGTQLHVWQLQITT